LKSILLTIEKYPLIDDGMGMAMNNNVTLTLYWEWQPYAGPLHYDGLSFTNHLYISSKINTIKAYSYLQSLLLIFILSYFKKQFFKKIDKIIGF
jgi:hypothetical protein